MGGGVGRARVSRFPGSRIGVGAPRASAARFIPLCERPAEILDGFRPPSFAFPDPGSAPERPRGHAARSIPLCEYAAEILERFGPQKGRFRPRSTTQTATTPPIHPKRAPAAKGPIAESALSQKLAIAGKPGRLSRRATQGDLTQTPTPHAENIATSRRAGDTQHPRRAHRCPELSPQHKRETRVPHR